MKQTHCARSPPGDSRECRLRPGGPLEISRWRKPPETPKKAAEPRRGDGKAGSHGEIAIAPAGARSSLNAMTGGLRHRLNSLVPTGPIANAVSYHTRQTSPLIRFPRLFLFRQVPSFPSCTWERTCPGNSVAPPALHRLCKTVAKNELAMDMAAET